jgi:hypothetical protein
MRRFTLRLVLVLAAVTFAVAAGRFSSRANAKQNVSEAAKKDSSTAGGRQDPVANQHNAVAAMRALNTALVSYYVSYAVYPATLGALAVSPGDSISQDHAGLLTGPLACAKQPCTFHNYLFTYKKTDAGYVITARPKKYGEDGKLSLYSGESGVIRGTLEDREATGKDKPAGTNY